VIVPRLALGASGAGRAPLSHQRGAGGSGSDEPGERLAVQRQPAGLSLSASEGVPAGVLAEREAPLGARLAAR
jgi:hypothetical protein